MQRTKWKNWQSWFYSSCLQILFYMYRACNGSESSVWSRACKRHNVAWDVSGVQKRSRACWDCSGLCCQVSVEEKGADGKEGQKFNVFFDKSDHSQYFYCLLSIEQVVTLGITPWTMHKLTTSLIHCQKIGATGQQSKTFKSDKKSANVPTSSRACTRYFKSKTRGTTNTGHRPCWNWNTRTDHYCIVCISSAKQRVHRLYP